ncbi:MAG: peptidoglycan DD-metalloendopeptidase family protein [Pyrinomonadaceae bacterium]|nr:peptidoglycan DD-metalloendopeptidase family protein [Pyrinomonadaceae bacterium]
MISARGRVFLALLIGIATLVVVVAFLQRRSGHYRASVDPPPPTPASTSAPDTVNPSPEQSPTPVPETPSPSPVPEAYPASPTPSPANASSPAAPPIGFIGLLKLIVPVAGVQPNQLLDTFADSRSEGRSHDAIDIPAAQGTPVVAAADGQIVKLSQHELGGITIYQLSTDKKLNFYYAHLQRYADGLSEGRVVRQGELLGYVGDTGNAGPGNYHLHFSIAVVSDPKRYWEGTNINPYPLLRN